MADQPAPEGGPKPAPVVIKKYANRRLYNTATSAYVTLDHLSQMVKDKTDFVVYDAKTGEEITRSVLTQIIFEEESKGGQTLPPIPFLRQLISFYGDSLQGVVPQYLEMSMTQFARNQEQMRRYLQNAFGFNPSSSSNRWASRTWRCSSKPCACSIRSARMARAAWRRRRPTARSRRNRRRRRPPATMQRSTT
jgi:polyhydroxyalkanoate synthesis repressor PhaR